MVLFATEIVLSVQLTWKMYKETWNLWKNESVVHFYFSIHHRDTASFIGKELFCDAPQFNKFEERKEDDHSLQLTAAQCQQAVTGLTKAQKGLGYWDPVHLFILLKSYEVLKQTTTHLLVFTALTEVAILHIYHSNVSWFC